jgi:hypothetical protein
MTRVKAAFSERGWKPPVLYSPEPSAGAHRVA